MRSWDDIQEPAADPGAGSPVPEPTVHTHEPTEVQGQSLRTHPLHPQNGRKSKTTTQNRRDKPNPGRRHSTADTDGRIRGRKDKPSPLEKKR